MSVFTMGGKRVVCEAAAITVIMPDFHSVMGGELFEGLFRSDGFVGREVAHKVDVPNAREVVNENGGGGKSLLGEFPF